MYVVRFPLGVGLFLIGRKSSFHIQDVTLGFSVCVTNILSQFLMCLGLCSWYFPRKHLLIFSFTASGLQCQA